MRRDEVTPSRRVMARAPVMRMSAVGMYAVVRYEYMPGVVIEWSRGGCVDALGGVFVKLDGDYVSPRHVRCPCAELIPLDDGFPAAPGPNPRARDVAGKIMEAAR